MERVAVVVIGGANLDVLARSSRPLLDGTSNPGTTTLTPGGVGRNIAENLARLGTSTALVAAIGEDVPGDRVLAATAAAGVDVTHVRRVAGGTGTYTAVLDAGGDLVAAVADMVATEAVTPAVVDGCASLVAGADLLVLDGNLALATLEHAIELAHRFGTRVVLEPVSAPKAAALRPVVRADRPLYLITPNADELGALGGLASLHERGVELVWVRRGKDGSLLNGPDGTTETVPVSGAVVDVTGAGDAMLAGFCHALLAGADAAHAAAYGQVVATLTVASPHTVHPDLTDALVRSHL